jgi:hypothetical protein
MASALTTDGKNILLNSDAAWPPAYGSVHNVDAPTNDTTEPVGGSPAYARKALTWGSSTTGSKPLAATFPAFDIPAGFTVKSIGLWSASSGGTLYGYFDVVDEAFTGQGTYTLTAGSVSL